MSDTPLTDAAVVGRFGDNKRELVSADFARSIERALSVAVEEINGAPIRANGTVMKRWRELTVARIREVLEK